MDTTRLFRRILKLFHTTEPGVNTFIVRWTQVRSKENIYSRKQDTNSWKRVVRSIWRLEKSHTNKLVPIRVKPASTDGVKTLAKKVQNTNSQRCINRGAHEHINFDEEICLDKCIEWVERVTSCHTGKVKPVYKKANEQSKENRNSDGNYRLWSKNLTHERNADICPAKTTKIDENFS